MASIQNRNGHFQVTVSRGYDVNGKKIRETRTFTPDPARTPKQQERDLQQFVREFEDEIESGISQDGRKITFKAFSERWLSREGGCPSGSGGGFCGDGAFLFRVPERI